MQHDRLSHHELSKIAEEFRFDVNLRQRLPRDLLIDLAVYVGYPRFLVVLLRTEVIQFLLRSTSLRIKEDDVEIRKEGVHTMTIAELKEECRERGLSNLSNNGAVLRARLDDWLHFSLDYHIPVPMMLLTRTLLITAEDGSSKRDTAVAERLRDFPAELVDEIKSK
jgi:LETM1 and EF-hand domain-containing protein 1